MSPSSTGAPFFRPRQLFEVLPQQGVYAEAGFKRSVATLSSDVDVKMFTSVLTYQLRMLRMVFLSPVPIPAPIPSIRRHRHRPLNRPAGPQKTDDQVRFWLLIAAAGHDLGHLGTSPVRGGTEIVLSRRLWRRAEQDIRGLESLGRCRRCWDLFRHPRKILVGNCSDAS